MKKFTKIFPYLFVLTIVVWSVFAFQRSNTKTIAILLYDGFNLLDAVGAIQTFPGLYQHQYRVQLVAKNKGDIHSAEGQTLQASQVLEELSAADILFIPGGTAASSLGDPEILSWIQKIDAGSSFTMAVGNGALMLGQTAVLKDRKAAAHWHQKAQLEALGAAFVDENYVRDGKYYTGKGASAAIDMVLDLIRAIAGADQAKAMQLFIEYDPAPPVQCNTFEQEGKKVQQIAQDLLQGQMNTDTINRSCNITMVLYEGFTLLDFAGPFTVLKQLEPLGYKLRVVADKKGAVPSDMMLAFQSDFALKDIDSTCILFMPGGTRTAAAMMNSDFINWVKKMDGGTQYTTSVCTGSLVYAKAGLLENRKAATHWYASKFLKDYQVEYSQQRYTVDGKYITGAGVSSGIDLGLLLIKELAGPDYAKAVQLVTGYFPGPPFDAGSTTKSDPATVQMLSSMYKSADRQYEKAKN